MYYPHIIEYLYIVPIIINWKINDSYTLKLTLNIAKTILRPINCYAMNTASIRKKHLMCLKLPSICKHSIWWKPLYIHPYDLTNRTPHFSNPSRIYFAPFTTPKSLLINYNYSHTLHKRSTPSTLILHLASYINLHTLLNDRIDPQLLVKPAPGPADRMRSRRPGLHARRDVRHRCSDRLPVLTGESDTRRAWFQRA